MNIDGLETQIKLKDTLDSVKTGQELWTSLEKARSAQYSAQNAFNHFTEKFYHQTEQILALCENFKFKAGQFIYTVEKVYMAECIQPDDVLSTSKLNRITTVGVKIDNELTNYSESSTIYLSILCEKIFNADKLIEYKHHVSLFAENDIETGLKIYNNQEATIEWALDDLVKAIHNNEA